MSTSICYYSLLNECKKQCIERFFGQKSPSSNYQLLRDHFLLIWLTSFTALMELLPLETTDSDLASTAVRGDSPPCEDALYKNTPCFLLRADIWKAFKDPAPIFLLHLKINRTSTQLIYWPVFDKLNTNYPLADKVHTLSLGEKKCTRWNNSNMKMTGVKDLYFVIGSRPRRPRQQAPNSSAGSLLLVIPL